MSVILAYCVVQVISVSKMASRKVSLWKTTWICLTWQHTTSKKESVEIHLETTVHSSS